jgi:hypothetical protein
LPGPPWGEDSAEDERVIAGNVRVLLREFAEEAGQAGSGTGQPSMQCLERAFGAAQVNQVSPRTWSKIRFVSVEATSGNADN